MREDASVSAWQWESKRRGGSPPVLLSRPSLYTAVLPPPVSLSGDRWLHWMSLRGFAAVRLAFRQLPPSQAACESLISLVLLQPDLLPNSDEATRIACPRLLPALFEVCARAKPPQVPYS